MTLWTHRELKIVCLSQAWDGILLDPNLSGRQVPKDGVDVVEGWLSTQIKRQDATGGGTSFLGLTPGWWLANSGIGRHLKEAVPYHK